MAQGLAVYNVAGDLVWDTDGILARVVGTAVVSFAAGETGNKTVTITGMVSTDVVIPYSSGGDTRAICTVSAAAPVITVTRPTGGGSGLAAQWTILVLRKQ